MSELKDGFPKKTFLSDELNALSHALRDEVPHLFCVFDREKEQFDYLGNIGDGEACLIIKMLAKQHGGEVLDRAVDELIEEEEDLGFPDIIECHDSRE